MLIHNFSGDVGLVPVGLFNLGPGAPPPYALVRQQHHAFFAVARALNLDRFANHQRERPIELGKLLRGNQTFGLAAQIHHHAEIGNRNDLAGFNLALRRCLMRRGVLLHQLFHLRVRLGRGFAGIGCTFHHVAHVGMLDGGNAIRRGHRFRGIHGYN